MVSFKRALAAHGATSLFVLLWSSGAIFAELGLRHASAFAFLTARFALASLVLLALAFVRRRWLPPRGERRMAALTGLLMMGGYSIFYLLALERGIAPGVLATILGVQPILTLAIVERRWQPVRIAGLALSLAGLALVVGRGVSDMSGGKGGLSAAGIACALTALVALTVGSLLQKRVRAAPADVLPLQNAIGLALCIAIAPFRPVSFDTSWAFVVPLLWLGIVISVIAQLLFYRLMQRGDLVNVTSLFYLVPVVTTLMDAVWLGNRPEPLALAGMGAIVAGLALVFRTPAGRPHPERA
ncbi:MULTISPECIES: DMT family transporter [Burkholderia]|uniref:EamA-like transporter family protein n=1 Tax=Burkholderia cepacia TaxID=292 RepID=A0AA88ZAN3_BURCE|nr:MULTISPECIES: DMT family transporter [Burkholderia]KGC09096.1 eamA-like transporter family protein [Burkholderia cepacia]KWE64037.1 multidrug DMT transporter permease [Burkholderia sp. MSMB2157WGS]